MVRSDDSELTQRSRTILNRPFIRSDGEHSVNQRSEGGVQCPRPRTRDLHVVAEYNFQSPSHVFHGVILESPPRQ